MITQLHGPTWPEHDDSPPPMSADDARIVLSRHFLRFALSESIQTFANGADFIRACVVSLPDADMGYHATKRIEGKDWEYVVGKAIASIGVKQFDPCM